MAWYRIYMQKKGTVGAVLLLKYVRHYNHEVELYRDGTDRVVLYTGGIDDPYAAIVAEDSINIWVVFAGSEKVGEYDMDMARGLLRIVMPERLFNIVDDVIAMIELKCDGNNI